MIVRPTHGFGAPGAIRVTVGTDGASTASSPTRSTASARVLARRPGTYGRKMRDMAGKPLVRGRRSVLAFLCGPPPGSEQRSRLGLLAPRAELPAPLPRHARLRARHLARPRRARVRRLPPDALLGLDRRAPDRRPAADVRDRPARRAARRPASAPRPDGDRRPRALRRLRRAAVHDERDADRRARGGRRRRRRGSSARPSTRGCRTSSRSAT